ncbi:MAG: MoaD/ThiS family protein [Solidesulfovibrio sp. DCME]|uniref:MoaD/ThiS family protein n=1 Tax=Solidesulfovibrio sp. DCME TaxID=3447380 RepID=UPI003D0EB742
MSGAITVRALATLAGFAPPGGRLDIGPDDTVGRVAARLGLDLSLVGTVLLNDRPAEPGTRLAPGDTLVCIPPITGG